MVDLIALDDWINDQCPCTNKAEEAIMGHAKMKYYKTQLIRYRISHHLAAKEESG